MTETHSRTQVLLDKDVDDNPKCIHGPMLRFCRENGHGVKTEFFGCSACRSRKECPGGMPGSETAYQEDNLRVHEAAFAIRIKSCKFYCSSCNVLCKDTSQHQSCSIQAVTQDDIAHPTRILSPNSRDKTEAQYFFSPETVDQILKILKDLNCK